MIFWKPAAPIHSATWFDTSGGGAERFVGLTTRYSEKRSLDPLSGSTDKRDYRSQVALLGVAPGEASEAAVSRTREWFEFAGWILEDSLFRGPGAGESLWFIGGENDGYAGVDRRLYFADQRGRVSAVSVRAGSAEVDDDHVGFVLKRAVPSPSGGLLALFEEDRARPSSRRSPERLRLVAVDFDHSTNATVAVREVARAAAPGLVASGPRWAPDSAGMYFETEAGIFYLGVNAASASGTLSPERPGRYPACLNPATTSGGAISDRGRRLYYDDSAGEYRVIQEAAKSYYTFRATPWSRAAADGSARLDCRP
jgi:hypothetical protein